MPARPAIVLQEDNFVLASYDAVTIAIVDGLTAPEQMDSLATEMRSNAGAHPGGGGGIAFLFIIRHGADLPDGAVRSRFQRLMKSMEGKLRLMAVAIEGAGFATAAKRSVFTMLTSQILGKIKMKVHPDAPKACAWLAAEASLAGVVLPWSAELTAFVSSLPATKARATSS